MELPAERSGTSALLGLTILVGVLIAGMASLSSSPPAQQTNIAGAMTTATGGNYTAVTVYAHRIPAAYWAPCFATTCSAGTGPGTSMYFILYDASGSVVQTGFADEGGHAFTGLAPGTTYYLYPEDCDLCHGSNHDVVFRQWGDGTATKPLPVVPGETTDAWYSCTNGCG